MPRASANQSSRSRSSAPQISFTNWILGGSLISNSRNSSRGRRMTTSASRKTAPIAKKAEKNVKVKAELAPVVVEEERVKDNEKLNENAERNENVEGNENAEGNAEDKEKEGNEEQSPEEEKETVVGVKEKNPPSTSAVITFTVEENKKKDPEPKESEQDPAVTDDKPSAGDGDGENSSEWTAKQDAQIHELKAAGKSWKDIAAAVAAPKSDVQRRFKELMKAERSGGDNKTDVANESAATTQNQKESNDKVAEGKAGSEAQGGGDGGTKCDCGGRGKKIAGENQGGNEGAQRTAPKRLRADSVWSQEDCEILEMLVARHHEQKWLSVQSGFYNLTGRMILGGYIEAKFKELE